MLSALGRSATRFRVTSRQHPIYASKAPSTKIDTMNNVETIEKYLAQAIVRRKQVCRTLARTSRAHWTYKHYRLTAKRFRNLVNALQNRLHTLNGTMKYPYLVPMDLPEFKHRNPHIQAVTVIPQVERDPETLQKNEEMYYKLKGTRYH